MSVGEIKQELTRLTDAERFQLLDAIWDLIENKEQIESPAWHGEILAERAATIQSGKAKFLTIDELKERLRR